MREIAAHHRGPQPKTPGRRLARDLPDGPTTVRRPRGTDPAHRPAPHHRGPKAPNLPALRVRQPRGSGPGGKVPFSPPG